MNPIRRWFRVVSGKDDAPVPAEAREAVVASQQRREDAEQRADEMARAVAPLRKANQRNHFEPAIRATFTRRPA